MLRSVVLPATLLLTTLSAVGFAESSPTPASGDRPVQREEMDELRIELEEMRSELSVLRHFLGELVRLERRRLDALERALERTGESAGGEARASTRSEPKAERKRTRPPRLRTKAPAPARRRASRSSSTTGRGGLRGRVRVPAGEPVAYVYVENVRGRLVAGKTVQIEQSDKQFRPRWAVIEKGTTVAFPNEDKIFHNVFSTTPGNTFDLGLYRQGEDAKEHRFLRSGPVDVYCNIHPRMSANILVVPNQHFSKVSPDGTFAIEGIPSGKRKVVAWAPTSAPVVKWIDLEAGETAELEFALETRDRSHKNKLGRPYGSYQ